MTLRLQGVAVVTGASGGIGAAICHALSREGFFIVAQYRSGTERVADLATEIRAAGGALQVVRADLSDSDGVEALTRAVRQRLLSSPELPLRAVVNNAGKLLGPAFSEVTTASFDEYVNINLKAPFFLIQGLAGMMGAGSSIVNVSSASAHIASGGDIVYAMTKAALESVTKNAAIALGERGIRVNAVVPGYTNNGHTAFRDEAALAYMGDLSVLGGVASPQDVANAVKFLLSNESARTTGSLLDVTGGMALHPRARGAKTIRTIVGRREVPAPAGVDGIPDDVSD